jgi:hypothetical protein
MRERDTMPYWIRVMNFLSARLRRGVVVLLVLAALQALQVPPATSGMTVVQAIDEHGHTVTGLRSSLD